MKNQPRCFYRKTPRKLNSSSNRGGTNKMLLKFSFTSIEVLSEKCSKSTESKPVPVKYH